MLPFVELKVIVPFEMGNSPNMLFASVVLPEPFSPTKNVSASLGTQHEASDNIFLLPMLTVTLSYSTILFFNIYTIFVKWAIIVFQVETMLKH